jgi:ABC-2 type transport system ATP-binding protein
MPSASAWSASSPVETMSTAWADCTSARESASASTLSSSTSNIRITGKSTLLRVMAGTLPASGRQTLAGARLDADPEAYKRNVFFCDPATDAFDQVTARACTATLSEGDAGFDPALWQALVEGFSLLPHIEKPMYMLSTGSKRKVWLAAALASGRPLVLLDEPEGALDARSIGCLWKAVESQAGRAGRAIVIASSARLEHVPRIPVAGCIELPLR